MRNNLRKKYQAEDKQMIAEAVRVDSLLPGKGNRLTVAFWCAVVIGGLVLLLLVRQHPR